MELFVTMSVILYILVKFFCMYNILVIFYSNMSIICIL